MSEFVPRLTDTGIRGNPYWYSDNPFWQAGYGMPNCTCYAWGRFWEISGVRPNLSTSNAEDWFGYTQDGYARGDTPQLGAVICLGDPATGVGHVAVVEVIDGDLVTFSNSAWQSTFFYVTQGRASNNYGYGAGYTFQGFIYNPEEPIPPKPIGRKSSKVPLYYNKNFYKRFYFR